MDTTPKKFFSIIPIVKKDGGNIKREVGGVMSPLLSPGLIFSYSGFPNNIMQMSHKGIRIEIKVRIRIEIRIVFTLNWLR